MAYIAILNFTRGQRGHYGPFDDAESAHRFIRVARIGTDYSGEVVALDPEPAEGSDLISHAFRKIAEYAAAAGLAYPASPNITLVQEISALMLTGNPTLADLKKITCEEP